MSKNPFNSNPVAVCGRKARFIDADQAKRAIVKTREISGKRLYFYRCEVCNGFHLTKNNPWQFGIVQQKKELA